MDTPEKRTHRLRIKQTVERAAPRIDIDETRVMSEEDIEELQRQTDERLEAAQLAAKEGRKKLRDRLRQTILLIDDLAE